MKDPVARTFLWLVTLGVFALALWAYKGRGFWWDATAWVLGMCGLVLTVRLGQAGAEARAEREREQEEVEFLRWRVDRLEKEVRKLTGKGEEET